MGCCGGERKSFITKVKTKKEELGKSNNAEDLNLTPKQKKINLIKARKERRIKRALRREKRNLRIAKENEIKALTK